MHRLYFLLGVAVFFSFTACGQERICDPGAVQRCPCPNGQESTQTCVVGGAGWGACACAATTTVGVPAANAHQAPQVAEPEGTSESQAKAQAKGSVPSQPVATPPTLIDKSQGGEAPTAAEEALLKSLKEMQHSTMIVTRVSPPVGNTAGGEIVKIYGKGFIPGEPAFVFFGQDQGRKTRVLSPSSIIVVSPPRSQPGPVNLRVRMANGAERVLKHAFTYVKASNMDIRDLSKRKSQ